MVAGRTVLLLVALLAAGSAVAGDVARPVSSGALHFGLLVGPSPGRLVVGFLDESRGTGRGYDLAVLDLDGDGRPETRRPMSVQKYDDDWIVHGFSFTVDGRDYTLELDGLAPGPLRTVHVDWTVSWTDETTIPIHGIRVPWGHWTAVFINGTTALSSFPLAAPFLPRIRLGPPFRFCLEQGRRGPDPVLTVTFLDSLGASLRLAYRGRDEIGITLRLMRGDDVVLEADGEYG
jgi:hypothetical protein